MFIYGLFVLAISHYFSQLRWISYSGSLKTGNKNRFDIIDEWIEFIFIL